MKLLFCLLVLLKNGMTPAEGLEVFYSLGSITLRYSFNPDYNAVVGCCKLVQWQCFLVANNRGETDMYVGRVYFRNYPGRFEATITSVSLADAGTYRCGVYGFPLTSKLIHVTVSDISGVITAPFLPKSTIKPAVLTSFPSTPSVTEKEEVKFSTGWRTSHTLTAVLSVLLFAFISLTLIVCHLRSKKGKSSDKNGTSLNNNLEQNIVYSFVEFKPHHQSSEYVNLQIRSPEDTKKESVEYSTILGAAP